jgi:hypothetical protein
VNAPPSIALAQKAWVIAYQRAYSTTAMPRYFYPAAREECPLCAPTSVHYYRIIDRISRGEQP